MNDSNEYSNPLVSSSLASATGPSFSVAVDPSVVGATVSVRVGFSGAICDLDDRGRLKAALPLLERYCELTEKLSKLEALRRRYFDPLIITPIIRNRVSGVGNVSQWFAAATRRSDEMKSSLEKKRAEVRKKLGVLDLRLTERDDLSNPRTAAAVPTSARSRNRPMKKLHLSPYLHEAGLTPAQLDVAVQHLEYGRKFSEIALSRDTSRAAVYDLWKAVERKITKSRGMQAMAKRQAARNI